MTVSPRLRRAVLTAHVATSVGWLGSVAAYLALDVVATTGREPDLVRASYAALEVVALLVVTPLALASVTIGVVTALGTTWGLFRHHWVVVKLLLTVLATAVLVAETRTIRSLADAAAASTDPRGLPGTLPHSVGGLLVLLLLTAISVYKPRGLTRYGWRRQREQARSAPPS